MNLKRMLSIVLIIVMILTILPVYPATAQGNASQIYLIKYRNMEQGIQSLNGNVLHKYHHLPLVKAELTLLQYNEVTQNPNLEYIEEDQEVEVSLVSEEVIESESDSQAEPKITVIQEEAIDGQSRTIKVAVMDTGVTNSKDVTISGGASFVLGSDEYSDDHGHGSYVASVIDSELKRGNEDVSMEVALYALKVLNEQGKGTYSQVIEALEWAIDQDIDIVNMSLGGQVYSLALAETAANAYEHGVLLFGAAGNSGATTLDYPAKLNTVIAVGAVNEQKQRLDYSNSGNELDFVAFGENVPGRNHIGELVSGGGTSAATAQTAGIAAKYWTQYPTMSAEEIRELLRSNALWLGPNEQYGYGLVRYQLANQPKEELELPETAVPGKEVTINDLAPPFESTEDLEDLGEYRLQAERERLALARVMQEQNDALERDKSKFKKEDLIQYFGVTEEWVQLQLDAGSTLQELYALLWDEQENSSNEVLDRSVQKSGNMKTVVPERKVPLNLSDGAESLVVSEIGTQVIKADDMLTSVEVPALEQQQPAQEAGEQEETLAPEMEEEGANLSVVYTNTSEQIAIPTAQMSEAPYRVGLYSEDVSLLSGSLGVSEVDFTLPGRNGLSFSLGRSYNSSESQFNDMDVDYSYNYGAYRFTFTQFYQSRPENYSLSRTYNEQDVKYGCSGSTITTGPLWAAGTGHVTTVSGGTYTTAQARDQAINNPPALASQTVHACGVKEANRVYMREYSYSSSTTSTSYGSWTSGSSNSSYTDSSYATVQSQRNAMVSGSMNSSGTGGSYSGGYYQYQTSYSNVGSIESVITGVTPYNKTKTDPLDNRFPIGKGWSFNIPYLKFENGTTFIGLGDGSVYEVNGTQLKNYTWSDLSLVPDTSVTYNNRTSAYALKSVFGTNHYFDSTGNLIQIKDGYANTISFGYTNVSPYGVVVTSITDDVGNTIQIAYSSTQVTLTLGNRIVTYAKSSSNGKEMLNKVTDPMGRETTYSYVIKPAKFNLIGSSPSYDNPYALLTQVQHPTGAKSIYTYETNPVTRFIGSGQVNQAYRLAERKDVVTYSNQSTETSNVSTIVYSSDMAASHGSNTSFSTTLFDGLLETKMSYEKKYINSTVGSIYYHKQAMVSDGTIAQVTDMTYNEAKYRMNPIQNSSYYKNLGTNATTTPLTVSWVYDDYKNVTSSVDALGNTSTFNYDGTTHRLVNSSEPVNNSERLYTVIVSRDAKGSVTESILRNTNATGAVLQHVQYTYDTHGNVTLIRNKDTNRDIDTQIEYSTAYNKAYPTKITRPYKTVTGVSKTQVVQATYNPGTGQLATYVDGNGNTSNFTYDKLGRLIEQKHPDGKTIIMTIKDQLNEIVKTDEMDRKMYSKWNPLGLEIESGWLENGVAKAKAKKGYDMFGRVIWVEDSEGNRTIQAYDNWGRSTAITLADNSQTTVAYDDFRGTIITTDAETNRVRETIDDVGRVTRKEVSHNGGFQTIWTGTYDAANRLVSEQDGKNYKTTYSYNPMGNLLSVMSANSEFYSYAYNRMGQMTQVTYPDLQVKAQAYDELGQIIGKSKPGQPISDPTIEKFEYDNNGNRTKLTDAKGQIFTYTYNNRNFLLSKTGPGETISFTYNADGTRQAMTDRGNKTTSYVYDTISGQLNKVIYPDGKQITYSYDSRGNRSTMTSPFGETASYTYGDVNQLEQVKWKGSTVAEYDYLANGQLEQKSLGPQLLSQSYTYTDGKMTGLTHKSGSNSNIRSYTYGYDFNMNITSIKEKIYAAANVIDNNQTFSYDNLNRITDSSLLKETYTYDSRGNRRTMISDAEIDLTGVSYEYDAWDRLTKVTRDGQVVEYAYNGDNLMIERKQNGQTTRYYYDGDQIIAEATVNTNGTVTEKSSYVRGVKDMILREDVNQNQSYYLHNGHGDVVEIRNSNGQVQNEYSYDLWGKPLTSEETVDNPFLYSGEYWDDTTQLQYLRARWYDPSVGRFINEDSYEGEITNPLSLNLYTYVANNPLRYTDPSGHCFWDLCVAETSLVVWVIGGIIVAVTAGATTAIVLDNHGVNITDLYESKPTIIQQPAVRQSPTVSQQPVEQQKTTVIQQPKTENKVVVIQQPLIDDKFNNGYYLPVDSKARVGRWMSEAEYKKMISTGLAQESHSGTTHVAFPNNSSAFERQAAPGSLYVEFDVPAASLKVTGDGWAKIMGPNSLEGRYARQQGHQVPQMPTATNIAITARK